MNFVFSDESDNDDLGFLAGLSQSSQLDKNNLPKKLSESTHDLINKMKSNDHTTRSPQKLSQTSDVITSQISELDDSSVTVTQASQISEDFGLSQLSGTSSKVDSSLTSKSLNEKHAGNGKTSSSLPLTFPAKFHNRVTMLVQLEDTKIDFSGDVGAIGRFHVRGQNGVMLDIKGHQYTGEIVPCGSFLVVGMSATEAKVESVISDYCRISRKKDVLDSMKGVVTQGIMDDSYIYTADEDVNRKSSQAFDNPVTKNKDTKKKQNDEKVKKRSRNVKISPTNEGKKSRKELN